MILVLIIVLNVCGLVLAAGELLGWIVPLVRGIRRRRRGEDGRPLIRLATVWAVAAAVLAGAWFLVMRSLNTVRQQEAPGTLSEDWFAPWIAAMVLMLVVYAPVLLGWLWPLVKGIRRRRTGGARGWGLIFVGVVWCALIFAPFLYYVGMIFVPSVALQWKSRSVAFDPQRYEAWELGRVTVGWSGDCQMTLRTGRGRPYELSGSGGELLAPTGAWSVASCILRAQDEQGARWGASLTGHHSLLVVRAGEATAFTGGPPFTAEVEVLSGTSTNAVFGLKYLDAAGQPVSIWKEGSQSVQPGFEAVAPGGVVAWRGNFEYG